MDGHTAGPWHTGEGKAEVIIYAENGYAVADAKVYHDNLHGTQTETARANARLIAAAPDLLAALESTLQALHAFTSNELHYPTTFPGVEYQAHAAISKAKGD